MKLQEDLGLMFLPTLEVFLYMINWPQAICFTTKMVNDPYTLIYSSACIVMVDVSLVLFISIQNTIGEVQFMRAVTHWSTW